MSLPPALLGPFLSALGFGPLDRFVSAEITTKDANGTPLMIHALGATIKAATSTEVTVTPNGGGADRRFAVGTSTQVSAGLGRSNPLDLTAGTHVIITTRDTNTEAQAIIAVDSPGGLPPLRIPTQPSR